MFVEKDVSQKIRIVYRDIIGIRIMYSGHSAKEVYRNWSQRKNKNISFSVSDSDSQINYYHEQQHQQRYI